MSGYFSRTPIAKTDINFIVLVVARLHRERAVTDMHTYCWKPVCLHSVFLICIWRVQVYQSV